MKNSLVRSVLLTNVGDNNCHTALSSFGEGAMIHKMEIEHSGTSNHRLAFNLAVYFSLYDFSVGWIPFNVRIL